MRRLVLVGGGHAHIEVLRDLAARPDNGVAATLVTPFPRMVYTGMLPGHIAGHYALDECTVDLAGLARAARAELRLTRASLVSPDARQVVLADGQVVDYDVLSIDAGSQPLVGNARGVNEHAYLARPLERLLQGWNEVYARAVRGRINAITVVGAGAGGIELALAINHRLRSTLEPPHPKVSLISDASGVALPVGARWRLRRHLRRASIDSHVGSAVTDVGAGYIRLASGIEFATEATFWVTGAAAPSWIGESGLATDAQGFLLVNSNLQSRSHPDIFGAGDCVSDPDRPHPRAGVFAVKAAPVLAANLRAALHDLRLARYQPQRRFLALISTGERHAVGVWNGFAWQGRWAWRWKDRIDRRFVARYRVG